MHSLKLVYCMISITAIWYNLSCLSRASRSYAEYLYFDLSVSEERERSVYYSCTIKTQ